MFFRGCGWEPRFVEGDDPAEMHAKMAETMDWAIEEIHAIQQHARTAHDTTRPYWPMIVFRAPKGWTGPKEVDGKQVEGSRRRASDAWAQTPTQTAVCCCASCACRTSARMSSPYRRPAPSRRRT